MDRIGDPSYDFKYTYINIVILKTQHTPNIYQQTYPSYESLGASYRDMQRGIALVFWLNILDMRGLLGKGQREKKTHTYLTFKPQISSQKFAKNTSNTEISTPHSTENLSLFLAD